MREEHRKEAKHELTMHEKELAKKRKGERQRSMCENSKVSRTVAHM